MVSITVSKKSLLKKISARVSEEKLYDALHQIKCPVESEQGDEITLETTADRPDLLSSQGVARAVRGFLGIEKGLPLLKIEKSGVKVFVDSPSLKKRPFATGAVVENAKLDENGVKELFQLQEKLDLTHGRRRKRVSIGLYDFDELTPPFYYKAVHPERFTYIPLKSQKKMSLREILGEHPTGLKYAYTLSEFERDLPLLYDSRDEVLALIPIVNNAASAITAATKRIYIDQTGTDLNAMDASLNILCQDFADSGAKIKSVEIVYPDKTVTTPDAAPEEMALNADYANKTLGTALSKKQIADCLQKQRMGVQQGKGRVLNCLIPRYRADFLHPIDLVEEVALGFGYNDFEPKKPSVFTIGRLSGETMQEEDLRDLMAGAGFVEQWTYVLTSAAKHAAGEAVRIKNPVSSDYNAIRSALLPSLFDTLSKNTHEPYPQRVFEVGEVVVKDAKHHLRAVSQKRLACVSTSAQANLSEIASLALRAAKLKGESVSFRKAERAGFIEGRCVALWANGKEIGIAGELHPSALEKMQVQVPVIAFELMV